MSHTTFSITRSSGNAGVIFLAAVFYQHNRNVSIALLLWMLPLTDTPHIIANISIMSSGGGISRFATRKQSSSNEATNATTSSSTEKTQCAATPTPKFSFGLSEHSDALSTASDDEFGFLGGGGNSIGGDDFFMSDSGYNHEHDMFDEANSDSTNTNEVSEFACCESSRLKEIIPTHPYNFRVNRIFMSILEVLLYFVVARCLCQPSLRQQPINKVWWTKERKQFQMFCQVR
jgi:hypothetical protein